jgi:myo-inositol-1(or 4)-monophosphatase
MNPIYSDYLHIAIEAAKAAGRMQLAHAGGVLQIGTKSSDTDLVTEVDRACEARIREIILESFPAHAVLGEEEGQDDGNQSCRWIVDPLDGTLNYAHSYPFYCVSIALEIDGLLALGVVFDPLRNELFTATAGGGSYLNGAPIRVSGEDSLRRSMIGTGFAYVRDVIVENARLLARVAPEVRGIRRPGAAALDLCYVACGRLDGFWELNLNPWDIAAAMLLIREAGGVVSDDQAAPYQFGRMMVVASNSKIHHGLLDLLVSRETEARAKAS